MNEIKEPITDALQTKCSACGGYMHYSPAEENLKCLYCGNITELDKTAAEIKENDFLYWKDRADESAEEETIEISEIKCRQCGAVTTLRYLGASVHLRHPPSWMKRYAFAQRNTCAIHRRRKLQGSFRNGWVKVVLPSN